ncbi:MAG: DUF2791 family P-loop domain-containing protein, partial [Chloroflexi bacterium]|nr:DUF2791 family P-loop domain-containing protein [Chloroflexota bacterium]
MRAGGPNRDAVQALGSPQLAIERRFREQLPTTGDGLAQGTMGPGILLSGDFGTGKSHLLEYLQHIALEGNFVCSKVVISKETPLYVPAKLYDAAMRSAKVPDRAGAALAAVAGRIDFRSPEYAHFYRWVNSDDNGLSRRFAASVCVFERGKEPEVSHRIVSFWSGG